MRGANHYPQDIEHTAQAADPCLRAGYGAAFAAPASSGDERVVIVQEVERSHRARIDVTEIAERIREAVVEEHGLAVLDVVLLEPGTIPKTTSGKIRRRVAKQLWETGELARMAVTGRRPLSAKASNSAVAFDVRPHKFIPFQLAIATAIQPFLVGPFNRQATRHKWMNRHLNGAQFVEIPSGAAV